MKPFDLNALDIEEATEPFKFTFGDGDEEQEFVITVQFDPRIFRLIRHGELDEALVRLLGDEQFERLYEIHKPFDQRQINAIIEAWGAHVGTTLGEAPASSSSSKSTGRPSKRTSNGSTESNSPALSPDVSKD